MVIYYGDDLDQARIDILNQDNLKKITFNDDLIAMLDDLNQMSIFDSYNKIIIDNASFLLDDSADSSKAIDYLNSFDKEVICFIKNTKLDKFNPTIKSKKIKLIKKSKLNSFNKIGEIKSLCQELDIRFDNYQTFNYLVEMLPANYLIAKNELIKLKMYIGQTKATLNLVKDIIVDNIEANIFQLISLLLNKNKTECLNLYEKLIELKHQPVELIIIMSSQIMKIKFYKLAMQKRMSINQMISDLGLTMYQIKQMQYVNNISLESIDKCLDNLFKLDLDIKKGLVDAYLSLKFFLISFEY